MIIGIQGSRNFNNYRIFLRAMGAALSTLPEDDNSITIYSAGPSSINAMGLEFANITERSLKARGMKIKLHKVSPSWLEDNLYSVDYFAYFSLPKEPTSSLYESARAKDIEAYIFQFD